MISTLINDLEGFKVSIEEIIAVVVERARELGAEPVDVTKVISR